VGDEVVAQERDDPLDQLVPFFLREGRQLDRRDADVLDVVEQPLVFGDGRVCTALSPTSLVVIVRLLSSLRGSRMGSPFASASRPIAPAAFHGLQSVRVDARDHVAHPAGGAAC